MDTELTTSQNQNDALPGPFLIISSLLAIAGIGISKYALLHHIKVRAAGHTDAFCNISETVSCDKIALSAYSEPLGIPMGAYGVGFFALCLALLWLGARNTAKAKQYRLLYWVTVFVGILASIALFGISWGVIGVFCVICITTYTVIVLQGGLVFWYRRQLITGIGNKSFGDAVFVSIAVLAGSILLSNLAFQKIFGTSGTTQERTTAPSTNFPDENARPEAPKGAVDITVHKSPYSGLGEDYRKGNDLARVVLVEFADFQCPACAMMAETMRTVYRALGDRVLIVFKNYPLDKACNAGMRQSAHEFACLSAQIARCAGQYGKFWQYHDKVFDHQSELNATTAQKWAEELGITPAQIKTCIDSKDILAKIRDDVGAGDKAGVSGTPSLYINGVSYRGDRSPEAIIRFVEELLR